MYEGTKQSKIKISFSFSAKEGNRSAAEADRREGRKWPAQRGQVRSDRVSGRDARGLRSQEQKEDPQTPRPRQLVR